MDINYSILTDSSCDLPDAFAKKLGLAVVPLTMTTKEGTYSNYLDGREYDINKYYQYLRVKSNSATTSAPSVGAFLSEMEPILQDGKNILVLAFSSGLSCTYQSACSAADELREKYPERKIVCIDTLCASMGEGLLVKLVCEKRDEGASLEEAAEYAESIKLNICHWYTVDDLNYLRRGGRISKTTAILGSVLQIKPVMNMSNDGKLVKVSTARGRKAAIDALKNKLIETGIEPKKQTVMISHADCPEDAEKLKKMLIKEVGVAGVLTNEIGPVIGTHSGPGTLAFFFVGTNR